MKNPTLALKLYALGCLLTPSKSMATNYIISAAIGATTSASTLSSPPGTFNCDGYATGVLTFPASGQMDVIVSEDYFAWDDNYSTQAATNFNSYSDGRSADVALIDDNNVSITLYALIVYYSPNQQLPYLEVWHWTGSAFTHDNTYALAASAVDCTSINIDASANASNGYFVITWDDFNTGYIYVREGHVGTGAPTLYSTATITSPTGQNPDVAIHDDGNGNNQDVYLTYVSQANDNLYEGHSDIPSLTSGTFNGSCGSILNVANHYYSTPRIAAGSDLGLTMSTDWAVVFEDKDVSGMSSLYDIGGIFTNSSELVLTDRSGSSPGAINAVRNKLPVVTFDQLNAAVIVSWISSFSEPGNFVPDGSIAVSVDYAMVSINSTQYMAVPDDNLSSSANQSPIALAGKRDKDIFYCWYDDNTGYAFYKYANYTVTQLRLVGPHEPVTFDNQGVKKHINTTIKDRIFNPDDLITVSVLDNTGKILFDKELPYFIIEKEVNDFIESLTNGSFTFKLTDSNKNILVLEQITKL